MKTKFILSLCLFFSGFASFAQQGYINVHLRTLDELSSVPFTFNGTGSIGSFSLNDRPEQIPQNDLGSSQNGRLYSTGAINTTLYYRALGSTTWIATAITNANKVDGGATNTCYFVTTTGELSFFDGTTATVIGNSTDFGGSGAADVGSTWDNRPYVVAGGRLYRYSGAGTVWAQVGASTDNISVDGNPVTGNIVVCKTDQTVASITPGGVATNLGTPPAVNLTIDPRDVAVDASGNIYSCFSRISNNQNTVFRWGGGTTWTEEVTGLGMTNITGGLGAQVWAIGVNGKTVNNGNIFTRSFNGTDVLYIDDERIRTTPAAGNSIMIAVAPGTYTITETEPAGWDLVQVVVADPTNNSSSNFTARTATVVVAANETVNLTFENILLQSFAVTNSCATTFTENFGTGVVGTFGAALVGQTSYHYRGDVNNAGDGNYKIVSVATDWATFAQTAPPIFDHTTGNGTGRMMAVNGSYERGDFFRRRFTGLIVGATYTFSGWFANLTAPAPIDPNITFAVTNPVNSAVIATANTGDISSAGVWEQTSLVFVATTSTIDLILTNNQIGGNGNDLALDDITFQLTPPPALTANITNVTCATTTGSIVVTAPLGSVYEYSRNGTTYQSSPTFSGLAPGTYTLSVRYVGSTNCVVTTSATVRLAVCGNVFNDPNGNAIKDAGEPFITNGSVWANLVDPVTNDVIQSVQVQPDGSYAISGALPSTAYRIILSATNQTGNTNLTAATLPAGFVNTGVNLGGVANTGNNTGIITLTTGTTNAVNQNFAIEQPPTAGGGANSAGNPGGTIQVTVPANTFTNISNSTDPTASPNGVTGIRILGIPAGATTITINGTTYGPGFTTFPGGGVDVATDANGNPPAGAVSVDPTAATGTTTVTIQFRAIDAAGEVSANIGTAVLNLTAGITLGGNVFNDPNGNAVKDGTEPFITDGSVWANLVDPVTNDVLQSVQVSGIGAYNFTGVAQNKNYRIILSDANQTGNNNLTTATLPAEFVNTGVNLGGAANTGNKTGIVTLTTGTVNVANQNFAIEQRPTAVGGTAATTQNPVGTGQSANVAGIFSGTDLNGGTIASMRITAFPTGATSIRVGSTTYLSTDPIWPANGGLGLVVPFIAGAPSQTITVDPAAAGATSVTIPFVVTDNAGVESTSAANATVPFSAAVNVSGTVFNDANALRDNLINGIGTTAGTNAGGLYAILVNGAGNVVQNPLVNADGTYFFPNVNPANYTVILSTVPGTVGSTAPAPSLPVGWISTGEGTAPAGDGTVNTSTGITVPVGGVTGINFGVQQPPTANVITLAPRVNPGGTGTLGVPAASFGGADGTPGTIDSIRITSFPTNATTVTIGSTTYTSATFPTGGVSILAPGGVPALAISVDPVDGAGQVVINYRTKDNGGFESLSPGTVNVPFTTVTLSGTVFNDVNGLTDNLVNGAGTNAGSLNAILIDAGGNVAGSVPVNADGTYTIPGITPANYSVILSTSPGTIGSAAPTPSLPTGWVSTGEGTTAAGDGTINTRVSITVPANNVAGVNFGIEQPPVANTTTLTPQPNPGGAVSVTVPPSTFGATDPTPGTVDSIRITGFPINANSITVNGTLYTAATFPAGGISLLAPGGVPSLPIGIDPNPGAVTVSIPYVAKDNAGKESVLPGSANIPFNTVEISGTVFNDANALRNNLVDGVGINAGALNAILVDGAGNVVASVSVNANGTYNFTGITPGTYQVLLSVVPGGIGSPAPAPSLPAGWFSTGEGTAGAGDGTINTRTTIVVPTPGLTGVNFGIQQPPTANFTTAPAQVNPGGTTNATVPPATFGGTDPTPGTIDSIRITAFPSNATSITIGATTYTAATFPVGGVKVLAPGGVPTPVITVDPADGSVTVGIPYVTIDNGGAESLPGAANVPFGAPPSILISGRIYNDVNGDAILNGVENPTNAGNLFANLVDATGKVFASVPVDPVTGVYSMLGFPSTPYTIMLTNGVQTIGANLTASTLPTSPTGNWVHTGQNVSGIASTTNKTGVITIFTPASGPLENQDFAIEQAPLAISSTMPSQLNSNYSIQMPANQFSGTDNGGNVVSIIITAFPSNTISLTINGIEYNSAAEFNTAFPFGATIPTNSAGNPLQTIHVQPAFNSTNTIVLPYVTVDNAGVRSGGATVTMPFFAILPLTGLEFSGVPVANCATDLTWSTLTETDTRQFELEHRTDNGSWKTITVLPASGNSITKQTYRYLHVAPSTGVNYYRIRQVDKNGNYSYSNMITVRSNCARAGSIVSYPNPVKDELNIVLPSDLKRANIRLLNSVGQTVTVTSTVSGGVVRLNTVALLKGVYLLQVLQSGKTIYNQKVIKE